MRRRSKVALAAVALAVGAGHLAYWYLPRPHGRSAAASRLGEGEGELVLWVAHPHQNLGALRRAVDDPDRFFAALGGLLGVAAPRLPDLEPFGVPPASEGLLARGGDAWEARLRWYPAPAALARLAGRLAGNPWLAGGVATAGDERVEVRWRGSVWSAVAGEGFAGARPPAGAPCPRRLLAWVATATPVGPWPAGRSCLERTAGGLALRLDGRPLETPPLPLRVGPSRLVLAWTTGDEGAVLFDRDSGLFPGLPAMAAWAAPERVEELVPAGRVLGPLGSLRRAPLPGGRVVAGTDAAAVEGARRWLAGRPAPGAFALAVDVGPAAERSRALVSAVERLLRIADPPQARRWRDVATVLSAFPEGTRIDARVAPEGAALTLARHERSAD